MEIAKQQHLPHYYVNAVIKSALTPAADWTVSTAPSLASQMFWQS